MVFDCLYVNGHSLLNRPLEDRQTVLCELQHALQTDAVKLTEGFPAAKSARLMKAYAFTGLEGVVMKRKGASTGPVSGALIGSRFPSAIVRSSWSQGISRAHADSAP